MDNTSKQRLNDTPEPMLQALDLARRAPELFRDTGTTCGRVMKRLVSEPASSRVMSVDELDLLEHPFNMVASATFRAINAHHGACLSILPTLTMGAGWASGSKIEDQLDPICGSGSFQDLFSSVLDNRYEFGQGYMEVVRDDPSDSRSRIIGLHWLQAERMYRVESPAEIDGSRKIHLRGFSMAPDGIGSVSNPAHYVPSSLGPLHAPFGRAAEFIAHHRLDPSQVEMMSEVIDFRSRLTRDTAYAIPRWVSTISGLELIHAGVQHEFDYFYNRGMPHWLLFLLGHRIEKGEWASMQSELSKHVGSGNSFKGGAFNFDRDLNVEMFQMASSETTKSRYVENSGEMALHVVTGHGVPPRLAGIVLPGKIGAVNEAVMDVWLFQTTLLQAEQRHVSRRAATTLGNKDCNRGLDLGPEDFLGDSTRKGNGFVTVLEDENLMALQGLSRMDDPAAATDRDPEDGPLKNGQQRGRRGSAAG